MRKYYFYSFGDFSIDWIGCDWIDFSNTIFKQKVCRKMEIPDLDFLALRLLIPFSGANGRYVMDKISQRNVKTSSESEENDADNPTDTATPYRRIVVEIPAQMTTPIKPRLKKIQQISPCLISWLLYGSLAA